MIEIESITPLAAILLGVSAGILVITDDLRLKVGLLGFLYVLVSSLLYASGLDTLVVLKLVTGLTVSLVFIRTATQIGNIQPSSERLDLPTSLPFRMIAVLLVATASVGIGRSEFVSIPGISPEALSAALLLGGMGLLHVSIFERPSNVAIGIYCLLNGFDVVYVVLESSIAVMALLAMVHIGIAVVIGILEIDVEEPELMVNDS